MPATPQPAAASDPTRACVEASLRECPYLEVRQIVCRCHEGVVVLFGEVPSYYLKAVAQALVSRIEGVEYVDNRVKVRTALE